IREIHAADVTEIRLTGGGARSVFWRKLMADVFDTRVSITTEAEGPAFGAALLGGVAAGVFASTEEAAAALVHGPQTISPEPAAPGRYREIHAAYRGVYADLKQRFGELARLE